MALILIPVIAAVGAMLRANLDNPTLASTIGLLAFAALAIGVFASLVTMAQRWDREDVS